MPEQIPQAIINHFYPSLISLDKPEVEIKVVQLSGGLINQSYKLTCEFNKDFLVQKINSTVFAKPEDVQKNYLTIWEFTEFEFKKLKLPTPKYWENNITLIKDEEGNCWRAFEFIDNAKMLQVATKAVQAKKTAIAFANFTSNFDDFNIRLLKIVIPDFHNLNVRYVQFEKALTTENYERMAKALPMIRELQSRERFKHFYDIITESAEFPLRAMHHDAKIANILFNKDNEKVICLVDFDTVMPGYYFSDLGDIIRSMVSNEDENSTAFEKISVRKEFYSAIIEGYLSVMNEQLTAAEKKYIHYAGLLMIYMQALRFATDYLLGDVYYQTEYEEHNFNRATNQLILLQQMEIFLKAEYDFSI